MNFKNIQVLETQNGFSLVRLDFHHTRGDTMVYAVVAGEVKEDKDVHETNARFFLTHRVGSIALEQFGKSSLDRTELAGPIIGRSYEEMLAILEKQV